VASAQPELWVDRPGTAMRFYVEAFGAEILLQVGDGEDVVAQLDADGAVFWVGAAARDLGRLDPAAAGGHTGRVLLAVDDPDAVQARAVAAGAVEISPVAEEHGWRVGRIVDPFGHEWEIGRHLGDRIGGR
jgi:PhnB protein